MILKAFRLWVLLALLIGLTGCRTPPEQDSPRLNDEQLRTFFTRAQDPRRLWITVYRSEEGPVFSGACRLHPEQTAMLPFISDAKSKDMVIDFKDRGIKSYRALVDTSSSQSWLTYEAAQEINITPLGPPAYELYPSHVRDAISGYACAAQTFMFDKLYMETPLLFTYAAKGPFGPIARSQTSPRPDAIIGCNMLKAFRFVQFDYPHRIVTLSSTFDYKPSTNLVASAALRETHGIIAVAGVVNDTQQMVLLDTAGDYEVAVDPTPDGPLRHVSVGSLVFRQVSATNTADLNLGLTEIPRIGNRLLSKFVVTFDFSKRTVYFEKP